MHTFILFPILHDARRPREQGSRYFTYLSRTISLTKLSEMASLADSGRVQNAMKYCLKLRKTGTAGQRVE